MTFCQILWQEWKPCGRHAHFLYFTSILVDIKWVKSFIVFIQIFGLNFNRLKYIPTKIFYKRDRIRNTRWHIHIKFSPLSMKVREKNLRDLVALSISRQMVIIRYPIRIFFYPILIRCKLAFDPGTSNIHSISINSLYFILFSFHSNTQNIINTRPAGWPKKWRKSTSFLTPHMKQGESAANPKRIKLKTFFSGRQK